MTRMAIVVVAVMNLSIATVGGAQLLRKPPRLIEVGDRGRFEHHHSTRSGVGCL